MSYIEHVNITNFKSYKGLFSLKLNECINVIVGNNEAGKSTILEALHLALSGMVNGKYLKNELSSYLFNKDIEDEYIVSLKTDDPLPPPEIIIEVFFSGDCYPELEGDANSLRRKACGIVCKIEFDPEYQPDYDELIKEDVSTIPIEYYRASWMSFARENVSMKAIPIKSVLIDSSSNRFQNGSDVYISKIIKDDLIEKEIVALSQAYRKMKEGFMVDKSIEAINSKITGKADISTKSVTISVDFSNRNSWETSLMTYLEGIPFHQIGKGEQCLIKTNLALSHKKTRESNLILIEEPENHLSHSRLNRFVQNIKNKCEGKQIVISTHSSFVANKLQLNNLILLHDRKEIRLKELSKETYDFFEKLPGYDTLRMILCKKAILVEGPSDELIVQRAYIDRYKNGLPIENEIDIISVGLTSKRFLEIAAMINKPVAVVTDNDHDFDNKIRKKYADFDTVDCIKIFADDRNELNTLEPQIVDANKDNLEVLRKVLDLDIDKYSTTEKIIEYMIEHKTESALKIFGSDAQISYPAYINNVIDWCHE